VPLQGLQHGGLHLLDALPQELLRSRLQQLIGLHDLALGHASNGQGNAMGCLNALAHGVQGHHLERQSLNVRDKPPCPRPSSHYRVLLRGSTTSTCKQMGQSSCSPSASRVSEILKTTDTPRLTQFSVTKFQNYVIFKKAKKKIIFLKGAPNVSLPERKRKETKVQEEYCWAVTKARGRGGGGHAAADQVPVFWIVNFKLDSLVYTYKARHTCTELGLASDLPGRKLQRQSGGVCSVLHTQKRKIFLFNFTERPSTFLLNKQHEDMTVYKEWIK